MTEVEPAPELVHLLKLRSVCRGFLSSLLPPIIINYALLLLLPVATCTGFTHLMAQASIFIVWHQVWFLLRNSFMLAFIQYTVAYPVHILVVLSGQVVV